MTYDGVGGMRSVPQVFFGMTRLATLLLSLGPAKLVRHNRSFWVFFPLVEGSSRRTSEVIPKE